MTKRIKTAALAMLIACAALLSGCQTTEGDMPWGAPEPWEGSPYIPGINQY